MGTLPATITLSDLAKVDLFSSLSDRELEKIRKLCHEYWFDAGKVIGAAGTEARELYVLLQGAVDIEIVTNTGQRRIVTCLETVRPCGVFSWSALVEPRILTAWVRCTQRSRVVGLDGRELLELFDEFPYLGLRVMRNLSAIISSRLAATRTGLQREIRQLLTQDW